MNGVQDSPESRASTETATETGYIGPFDALPLADPASLPDATLNPDQLRALRDRSDPLTAHRTRRNRR